MSEASNSPAPDANAVASSATSPAAASAAASNSSSQDPQLVGNRFVSTYYRQLLEGSPEQMIGFYVPSPTTHLSHGEGSTKTTPVVLDDYKPQFKARWCDEDSDEKMQSVDFGQGAIDVHETPAGGILVVVTAEMQFKKSKESSSGGGSGGERRKAFVQTFLIGKVNGKWGVQNDVLRFLKAPLTQPEVLVTPAAQTSSASTNTEPPSPSKDVSVGTSDSVPVDESEKKDDVPTAAAATAAPVVAAPAVVATAEVVETVVAVAEEDDAPGGGVEESKEEPPEDDDEVVAAAAAAGAAIEPKATTTEAEATKDDRARSGKNKGNKPPVPGSWASLVATGGSAPNTPSRVSAAPVAEKTGTTTTAVEASKPAKAAEDKAKDSAKATSKPKAKSSDKSAPPASKTSSSAPSSKGRPQRSERPKFNADCTLVIKNLDTKAKTSDVINMFKPFAVSTSSKLVGAHVNSDRNLAFVDFDSVAPVLAVLKKHNETPFQWSGQVLEVDQKSAEQRARREAARGGSYRSGSPSNGGMRNGGGGGNGRGRGDRGGRRGSRGGGGGGGGGGGRAGK